MTFDSDREKWDRQIEEGRACKSAGTYELPMSLFASMFFCVVPQSRSRNVRTRSTGRTLDPVGLPRRTLGHDRQPSLFPRKCPETRRNEEVGCWSRVYNHSCPHRTVSCTHHTDNQCPPRQSLALIHFGRLQHGTRCSTLPCFATTGNRQASRRLSISYNPV